jgi:uncharacterized protein
MSRQVLLVHSSGPQGDGEGSAPFAERLREGLGPEHEVLFPILPDPEDPHFQPWRLALEEILDGAEDPLVVVGHSLGASVVLKMLAEGAGHGAMAGLVLMATPMWGRSEWEAEWALPEGWPNHPTELPPTFLFHSRDDEEIPIDHLERYAARLPQVTARRLDGNGHLFDRGDLTEILETIRALTPS